MVPPKSKEEKEASHSAHQDPTPHHSPKEDSPAGHKDASGREDEGIVISGKAVVIALIVILAVALVVWRYQAASTVVPPPAPNSDQPAVKAQVADEVAAKVNGESIMRSEILHQLDQIPLNLKSKVTFDEVLNSTINERISMQEAKRLGIEVSDAEANAYLAMMLNKSGISRDDLRNRAKSKGIDEGEIIDIFRRRLTISELLQQKVFASINVTDKEVKSFFDSHKADLMVPETVHAKHILLAEPEEANATIERLKKGADFDQLAKDLSLDKGSAQKGGDLGNFTRGQMVPEFEQAAFSAKPGEIVGPVKSQFGYHIIKVLEHSKGMDRPFSELADPIKRKLLADKSEAAANAYVASLRAKADVEWLAKPSIPAAQ